MVFIVRICFVVAALMAAPTLALGAESSNFSPADLALFEKDVRPLLAESCFKCHGEKKQKGNLRLDARALLLRGGDHGPAVDLTNPDKSLILKAINYGDDEMQMPPDGKLPAAKIEILTKWVKSGAAWTPGGDAAVVAKPQAGGDADSRDPEKNRDYWAYKAPVRPAIPQVKDPELSTWSKNSPIDAFIASKLEAKGLKPVGPADKLALVRRAYYDLTGLPPSPEAIDAFIADKDPHAWEKLIDRLLASPQYGEKWGRHWLDLVRYAETHGYERDSDKPFAWRYRDYVINSFNADKPYDQFLKEQLAGDELDHVTPETMIATGYYRLNTWDDEPADRLLARYDVLDGIVSTTGSVILGTSMGCARCHDHKRDPVLQKDYYKLLAFFQDVSDMNVKNLKTISDDASSAAIAAATKQKQAAEAVLYGKIYAIEQEFLTKAKARGVDVAALAGRDLTDLTYRFYRDTWDTLPDFAALKPESAGAVAENLVSLAPASRDEAIGLVFEGKLQVPAAGNYSFHVRASDGFRLTIDGHVVADRSGKGLSEADYPVTLAAGLLPFKLEYFNGYTKPVLIASWSGPGFESRPLSRDRKASGAAQVLVADSREAGQTWLFTLGMPANDWFKPSFRPQGWAEGIGGFGSKGTPGAVVRTTWRTPQIYLRKEFTVDSLPSGELTLNIHHDEDVEVYLNGIEIYRASGFLKNYTQVPLGPEAARALKRGKNLIAVATRQKGGGQYIDVGLVAGSSGTSAAELIARHGTAVLGAEKLAAYEKATAELRQLAASQPPQSGMEVMCVYETGKGRPTHVLLRGNPNSEGDLVQPGFPQVLTPPGQAFPALPKSSIDGKSSGKRRVLAEWLASDKNPLTARVMANRIWQYHFGRGIVPTPNDFGKLGEPPTHPELLDYLATELVKSGWHLKAMHKQIMLSNAYQMSARATPEGMSIDPANNLFWRFNMRRLGAEEVRDSMLAVSGKLNLQMAGPPIYPMIPPEVLAGQSRPGSGWGKSSPEQTNRRSVYVHVKRSLLVPILNIHDQADTDSSCPVRFTTTVPTQALGMLNGEFTNEQATLLAERVMHEAPASLSDQVKRTIRLTTGRVASEKEIAADLAFIAKLKAQQKLSDSDALRIYCLMALNTNEFVYLD